MLDPSKCLNFVLGGDTSVTSAFDCMTVSQPFQPVQLRAGSEREFVSRRTHTVSGKR